MRKESCAKRLPLSIFMTLKNKTEWQYVEFSSGDGSIFTQNLREYPKTEGAIPSGHSPRGIAPEVFGYSLEFLSEYCNIHRAKLHILALFLVFWLPQYQYPPPRGEYGQYQPLGVNTDKYSTLFPVLWRQKT